MKLRALRLYNVKKFANRGVAIENIGDGVNVLSAENEFGKSTSFDALHAVFFQSHAGTPKAVKQLRPYSGGSPKIEVDVETDAGLFRITKQFYGGKCAVVTKLDTNTIIKQADEAEAWISKLVGGGDTGPTGLLWVQQGATEIGGGTKVEETNERKVREDLLSSVTEDEVELLTGGRRMVRVLEKTQSQLNELVTATGKAKTSGPYDEASKQLEALKEEEKRLAEQIEALQADLVDRRKQQKRLKEISDPEEIEKRNEEFAQAELNLQQAKQHQQHLDTAIREENLAKEKLEITTQKSTDYQAKIETKIKLEEKLGKEEVAYKEQEEAFDKALLKDKTEQENLETSKQHLDALRQKREQAHAAKAALEAATKLKDASEQLEKAEEARREMETLQAACDNLSIKDDDVEYIEDLAKDISILENTIQSESSTLALEYNDPSGVKISRNGTPLETSQSISLSEKEVFQISDIGTLTFTSGSSKNVDEKKAELKVAQEELAQMLVEFDLTSVNEVKFRQNQFKSKSSDLKIKQAELRNLAPDGLENLRARVEGLKSKITDAPEETLDVSQIEGELEIADLAYKAVDVSREASRASLDSVKEAYQTIKFKSEQTKDQLALLNEELGSDFEINERAKTLIETYKAHKSAVDDAANSVGELKTLSPNLEAVQATHDRLKSAIERARTEKEELSKNIAELNGRIGAHSQDAIEEEHAEIRGKRQSVEARVAFYEHEIDALQLLQTTLNEARLEAKEQFFQPVMEELKPLIGLLFDDASITFDDETLLPQTLERKGQDEDISYLSGGMREQLAILTRLAFARLLAKRGNPVPVILDDALVYSDDDRIERMFDALHRQANDIQILALTCRQRAFEKLGGKSLQLKTWSGEV